MYDKLPAFGYVPWGTNQILKKGQKWWSVTGKEDLPVPLGDKKETELRAQKTGAGNSQQLGTEFVVAGVLAAGQVIP